MSRLMPRQLVPPLEIPSLSGSPWRLSDQAPVNFTLVVVYRGLHCPVCRGYLKELATLQAEFSVRGVAVIALSTDTEERARLAQSQWELGDLPVGYGLTIESARAWGLYVSSSRGKTSLGIEEPPQFAEPGVFLVRADGTLYAAAINTMPFARPHFQDILGALDFIVKNDYPARGEA
jgi:peroxiredoxin